MGTERKWRNEGLSVSLLPDCWHTVTQWDWLTVRSRRGLTSNNTDIHTQLTDSLTQRKRLTDWQQCVLCAWRCSADWSGELSYQHKRKGTHAQCTHYSRIPRHTLSCSHIYTHTLTHALVWHMQQDKGGPHMANKGYIVCACKWTACCMSASQILINFPLLKLLALHFHLFANDSYQNRKKNLEFQDNE